MHILVIDDSTDRLDWFQDTLEGAGHDVRLAATPRDALEQMHESVFDLVFFDHDLGDPELNGSRLAYQVFQHPKKFKRPGAVWIHSSNTTGAENIAAKCQSAGVKCGKGSFESFMKNPAALLEAITRLTNE